MYEVLYSRDCYRYFVTSLWSGWVIDHATRTDDSLWRPFALMQPCHFWQKANVLLAHRQACSSGKVCRAKLLLLLLLLLWRCWCDAGLCICNLQGNIYWNIWNILNQIELEKSFTWIWWDLPAPPGPLSEVSDVTSKLEQSLTEARRKGKAFCRLE